MDLITNSLIHLTSDTSVMQTIYSVVSETINDEVICLSDLEVELSANNINLLNLMENSLFQQGYSQAQIDQLGSIFKKLTINNRVYNIFIYVPFTNIINYDNQPVITSQFQPISQLSELDVFSVSS